MSNIVKIRKSKTISRKDANDLFWVVSAISVALGEMGSVRQDEIGIAWWRKGELGVVLEETKGDHPEASRYGVTIFDENLTDIQRHRVMGACWDHDMPFRYV